MPARHKTIKIPLDSNHGIYRDRRVYAEVSQEGAFRQDKTESGPSISRSGATQGVPDRGRTFDAGSRSHVDIDTSQIFGGADHRIHEREEFDMDVRPAKAGMFSRRQTCRGRSQSPVVWIAEVMETETLKPIDKVSPGEATSHRAVIAGNALWPRKELSPGAELASIGRRQHEQPNTDRHDCSSRRGGSDSTVTRTCRATGEALLVPARNRRSMVGRITGETGKSAEDERVAAGSVVAMKRSNVRGAK